jgi:hypothetical protein
VSVNRAGYSSNVASAAAVEALPAEPTVTGVSVGEGSIPGTFTMTGGTIHGNTGGSAGGVYIALNNTTLPRPGFTKTGGTIYGYAGDRFLDNEAAEDTPYKGHAVCGTGARTRM